MVQIFNSSNLPEIDEMSNYLRSRALGPEIGIEVVNERDAFGNLVIYSRGKSEETLEGTTPSTIVISRSGAAIIRNNPGLLRRIYKGDSFDEEIGRGKEGRVYKASVRGSTYGDSPEDNTEIAIKYTFPVNIGLGRRVYTPGIDQMRLLQAVSEEQPLPGLLVISPHFATLDVLVTDYVIDSYPLIEFHKLFSTDNPDYTRLHSSSSMGAQNVLARLTQDADDSIRNDTVPFVRRFTTLTSSANEGLGVWVKNFIKNHPQIPLISTLLSPAEANTSHNLIVDIKALGLLYEDWMKDPGILDLNNPKAVENARRALVLTEVTYGTM